MRRAALPGSVAAMNTDWFATEMLVPRRFEELRLARHRSARPRHRDTAPGSVVGRERLARLRGRRS